MTSVIVELARESLFSTDLRGLHTRHSRPAAKAEGTKGSPDWVPRLPRLLTRDVRSAATRKGTTRTCTHHVSSTTPAHEEQTQDKLSERRKLAQRRDDVEVRYRRFTFLELQAHIRIAFGIAHALLPLGKQCLVLLHGASVRRMPFRICHRPGLEL